MQIVDLYSGIGGFSLSGSWIPDWRTIQFCEIDKFCQRVLSYHFPGVPIHEDIKTLTSEIVKSSKLYNKDEKTIVTGGFPCFIAGTQVLTQEGYKSIEDVNYMDLVLTQQGTWGNVNALMNKENAQTLQIKYQGGFESLITTVDHPFWVRKRTYPYARTYKNRFGKAGWFNSSELNVGDLVSFRCIDGNVQYKNYDFWYFVGRFLGDGWVLDGKRKSKISQGHRGSRINSKVNKVVICCGKHEKEFVLNKIHSAGYNPTIVNDKTVIKFIICDKELMVFLKQFGRYAIGKKVPGFVFNLTNELKEALFTGWLESDGYTDAKGIKKVTTISKDLALGMSQIARDCFKMPVYISKKTPNRKCIIENRVVNEQPSYCVSVNPHYKYGFYEDGIVWTLISKIEKGTIKKVYNIGVKNEETYTANGIIVHNCQPWSLAGKRKGTEDVRNLWPETIAFVKDYKPDWCLFENVYGLVNWDGGVVFEQVCTDLENAGYEVQTYLLPACSVNAPHRRDRIWIVAYSSSNADGLRSKGGVGMEGNLLGKQKRTEKTDRFNNNKDKIRGKVECSGATSSNTKGSSKSGGLYEGQGEGKSGRCDCKDAFHTDSRRQSSKEHGEKESGQFTEKGISNNWANFPTVPPLCDRNDGVSFGLVGITFSKWRNESIKCLGNSVVVPLVYQLLKSIDNYENTKI